MEEILVKLSELEGQIVTKEMVMKMLEEAKTAAGTSEVEKKVDALIQELASIKAGKGETFGKESEGEEVKKQQEIFGKYLKYGMAGLSSEERKTMTSNVDTTGGFLAGRQLDKQVIKDIREMNAMMSVATIKQTTSKDYVFIKVVNIAKASNVKEGTAATAQDVTFEKITISTYDYKNTVAITETDIEDAEINIVNEVTAQMGEGLAEAVEYDFISGNGVEKAKGFLTDATILANAVETKTAGTFIDEDIITLVGSIKTKYRRNISFMASREILTHIMKMKDGTGKFQFSMEPLANYPTSIASIMGRPVYEAPSMATTVAAGNLVLAAGDFAKGYVIVERIGTVIKRDDITGQAEGIVKFNGRKRLGGMVVQPEAIKVLKVKA